MHAADVALAELISRIDRIPGDRPHARMGSRVRVLRTQLRIDVQDRGGCAAAWELGSRDRRDGYPTQTMETSALVPGSQSPILWRQTNSQFIVHSSPALSDYEGSMTKILRFNIAE